MDLYQWAIRSQVLHLIKFRFNGVVDAVQRLDVSGSSPF